MFKPLVATFHRADTWLVLHITQPGGCWLNSQGHLYTSSETQTVQAAVDKWAGTASLWPLAGPGRAGGRAGTPVQACRRRAPPVCKSEHISALVLPCTLFRSVIWEQTGRAAFLFSSMVHRQPLNGNACIGQSQAVLDHNTFVTTFLWWNPQNSVALCTMPLYLLAVSIKHDPTDVCPKWARGVVANEAAAYEPQCLNNRKLGSSVRWFHWTQVFPAPVGSLDCGRSIPVSSKRPSVAAPLFVLSAELTQEISTLE